MKAYFALKLMGDDPNAATCTGPRADPADSAAPRSATASRKFYFACLGQISFDACPSIPPEIVFLPQVVLLQPVPRVGLDAHDDPAAGHRHDAAAGAGILPEHWAFASCTSTASGGNRSATRLRAFPTNWRELFLTSTRLLEGLRRSADRRLREQAMRAAEKWLLERMDNSEGLGAIFPPMVYMLIVFRALGYADDHPRVVAAHKHLQDFFIEEGDTIRLQPCFSPVWDTGIALHALAEAGSRAELRCGPAQHALAARQGMPRRRRLAAQLPKVEPSRAGSSSSRIRTTPTSTTRRWRHVAASALRRTDRRSRPSPRGLHWLLAMQNDDGGWAAFDKTRDRPILEKRPLRRP